MFFFLRVKERKEKSTKTKFSGLLGSLELYTFFSHIFAILSKENCALIGLYPSYIVWCCLLFRCNKMCYINLTSWWLQYFLGKKKKKSLFYLVHGVLLELFLFLKSCLLSVCGFQSGQTSHHEVTESYQRKS